MGTFWDLVTENSIIDRLYSIIPERMHKFYGENSGTSFMNFEPLTEEQIKILKLEDDNKIQW